MINRWLDHIGEHDPETRAELLRNCACNPAGLPGILQLAAEDGISADPPSPEPVAEPVTCATCRSFERDHIGDGAGLGSCRIDAPASRRAPALWPHAPHRCIAWSPRA